MSEIENKFELRPLEASDIFMMTSIISKVGVKRIANCFKLSEEEKTMNDGEQNAKENDIGEIVFFNIADLVLERLEYCQDAICRLLSALSGMKEAEIKKMNPVVYLEMFMTVIKSPEFADFFTQAYELLKRMM